MFITNHHNDYCRYGRYNEHTFKASDISEVMRNVFEMDDNVPIPESMKTWGLINGFDKREAYSISIENDWYGDVLDVHLKPEHAAKAKAYYEMYKTRITENSFN